MDKELIKEMIKYIETVENGYYIQQTEEPTIPQVETVYPELYYKLKEWLDDSAEITEVNYPDGSKDYYKDGKKMY